MIPDIYPILTFLLLVMSLETYKNQIIPQENIETILRRSLRKGAISAGKAVVVTSDGKAGIVTGTNIQFGDKNPFAAASSTWGSIAYDTANNKLVIVFQPIYLRLDVVECLLNFLQLFCHFHQLKNS